MPLDHYGVAIGTLVSFTRDPQHRFGSWYHGHLTIDVGGGARWESALDVDAPSSVGVAYRLVEGLTRADLGPVAALAPGFHALALTPASGALDYVRSPALRDGRLVREARGALLRRQAPPTAVDHALRRLLPLRERLPLPGHRSFPWLDSSGDDALDALGPQLRAASRIYVFGERFDSGDGVHDVHLNQGDPLGSQWWDSNGIWQDGAVACQRPDGHVAVWQVMFKTQRLTTDAHGHPLGAA